MKCKQSKSNDQWMALWYSFTKEEERSVDAGRNERDSVQELQLLHWSWLAVSVRWILLRGATIHNTTAVAEWQSLCTPANGNSRHSMVSQPFRWASHHIASWWVESNSSTIQRHILLRGRIPAMGWCIRTVSAKMCIFWLREAKEVAAVTAIY